MRRRDRDELTAIAVLAIFGGGCITVTEPVRVPTSEIQVHVPELRGEGYATVAALPDGTYELAASQIVRADFPLSRWHGLLVENETRDLTVAELIAGCDPRSQAHPSGPCLADATTTPSFPVGNRTTRRADWRRITLLTGLAAVVGAVGATSYYASTTGGFRSAPGDTVMGSTGTIALVGAVLLVASALPPLWPSHP